MNEEKQKTQKKAKQKKPLFRTRARELILKLLTFTVKQMTWIKSP